MKVSITLIHTTMFSLVLERREGSAARVAAHAS